MGDGPRDRRGFLRELAGSCAGVAACPALAAGVLASRASPASAQDVAGSASRVRVEEGGLAPRDARWFRKLPEDWVECELCPRGCRISEGERGTCGVRENHRGTLQTLVHSRPCAVGLDPIEKKPFFHFLPGSAALSLGTAGCNLSCKCCQNWETAQARPEQVPSRPLTPADVVDWARRRGAPVVACTYTEPTVFSEYVLDIAVAGRRQGVRTVVVSNGYVQERPLAELCRALAAYKVDLKAFSDRFYQEQCGGRLQPVLDTLRRLRRHGTWVEIVVLVIPTLNDSPAEVRALARFVRDETGPDVPVHFTRFHPTYRLTNLPATPVATLERCREAALAEGLRFVYLGNVPGHPAESTYCPGCGQRLLHRVGMAVVENRLSRGACPGCGRTIPGVWS